MNEPKYVGNFGSNVPNTGPGLSPMVWKDYRASSLTSGDVPGFFKKWDFIDFKSSTNVNAAEAYWADGLMVFGSDGFAITNGSDHTSASTTGKALGTVTIGSDGDNEGGYLRQACAPVRATGLNATAASRSGNWVLEARLRTSTIADTKHNIFFGVMEDVAATAIIPITALGALADKNLIGFHRPESARSTAGTGGAIMNAVSKADGQTAVTHQTDALTLVADTYMKLALRYDAAAGTIYWYANGVLVASEYIDPTAGGSTTYGYFPNDINLGWICGVLNATGSTPGTVTLDWVAMAAQTP